MTGEAPLDWSELLAVAAKYTACFLASFAITTLLIRTWIPSLDKTEGAVRQESDDVESEARPSMFRSTGFWIGFFETLMIFAFVAGSDYGAIAIVIGAKELVRKENIQANPSYYLLGTLLNVSIALVAAIIAKEWIRH